MAGRIIGGRGNSGAAVGCGDNGRVWHRQGIHICIQRSQSYLVILSGALLHKEKCEGKGLVTYLVMNYPELGSTRRGDIKVASASQVLALQRGVIF